MEDACDIVLNTGLRGVTIADTRICDVDGANGKLIYRGYLIQDLAEATFEEVVHLLLYERLPDKTELSGFRERLAAERNIQIRRLQAKRNSLQDIFLTAMEGEPGGGV